LFHSPRFEAVIDGIQAFAAWVRVNQDNAPNGALGPMRESGARQPSSAGLSTPEG
jgi:hypothetical protein